MINKILETLHEENIDGFFISKIFNVRWLSKYTGSEAYLLVTKNKKYLITDPRYTEQASNECSEFEIINWRQGRATLEDAVNDIVKRENIKILAFEREGIAFDLYSKIAVLLNCDLVPKSNIVEKYRSVKSKQELEYLKISCAIAGRAFERILKDIKVGAVEKEIAAKLSYYMVCEGSDARPYGDIVLSGKKTSMLHGIPSDKKVEYGDFVLMDFGCSYKGYMSDMTRTVVVGKASEEQKLVYKLEQQMVNDSLSIIKEGINARDVYIASTKAIKNTKYYDYNYSNVGHGIGIYVHEMPSLTLSSTDVLKENNVITIEPGIYIPDWGGVRIEDQIVITKNGYENLVFTTKELIEL